MSFDADASRKPDDRSNYEDIVKPSAILTILRDLIEARTPIGLRLPRTDTVYASEVVSVDEAKGTFLIDEVLPLEANRLLSGELPVRVDTKVRDVEASFKTVVLQASLPRSGLHKLALPTAVRRYQKRRYFRAHCTSSGQVRLGGCEGGGGKVVTAKLRDLSIGGAGLWLTEPLPDFVKVGTVFHDCEIRVDVDSVLRCALEIRHLGHVPQSQTAIAGCRMLELDRPTQDMIARLVTRLELEQRTGRK